MVLCKKIASLTMVNLKIKKNKGKPCKYFENNEKHPETMKNHKNTLKNHENQPKLVKIKTPKNIIYDGKSK